MLLELSLKNFAIIDKLSVQFGEGLNVITGETGAGKSVIVDALGLVLGGKASADYVRSGEDEAEVEALFLIKDNQFVREKLARAGIDSGDELLVKRVIPRSGRGRIYINGSLSTSGILSHVSAGLVDVFSQHEHQSLLKEENHTRVLDEFGGNGESLARCQALYREWSELCDELKRLDERARGEIEREDYLRFQASEIDRINPEPGEDERLLEERARLEGAEQIRDVAAFAYNVLYEGDASIVEGLGGVISRVEATIKYDPAFFEPVVERLSRVLHEIEDSAFLLRDYAERTIIDPARLEWVEARLSELTRLKRKYGLDIEGVLEKRKEIERELLSIQNFDNRANELRQLIQEKYSSLVLACGELSSRRRKSALELADRVKGELGRVGLVNADFVVRLEERPISPGGTDRVSFYFSANPDEEPRPLAKVASGGELSRIMLVLKEAISCVVGSSVLIFDEADAGIGGAVAEAVGMKIKNLSKRYQVISITHLPQVAKFADRHFAVIKTFAGGRTNVCVNELRGEERVRELARMLGGLTVTRKTLEAAREMLAS
jgi:DNA repair protein RecN (Recombination protein N)